MTKKQDAPHTCPVCFIDYTDAACPNEQRTHGTPVLRYIGDGSALDNVPARTLTDWDLRTHDRTSLIASGLYAPLNAPESEA